MSDNDAKSTTDPVDAVILLLVSGLPVSDLAKVCAEKLHIDPGAVDAVITEARQRILSAADVDHDWQRGQAITRTNDLYRLAIKAGDTKTALGAQRELNKLLGLDRETSTAAPLASNANDQAADELAAIRGHLLPLRLAPMSYPISEHARIAADLIREQHAQQL